MSLQCLTLDVGISLLLYGEATCLKDQLLIIFYNSWDWLDGLCVLGCLAIAGCPGKALFSACRCWAGWLGLHPTRLLSSRWTVGRCFTGLQASWMSKTKDTLRRRTLPKSTSGIRGQSYTTNPWFKGESKGACRQAWEEFAVTL